MDPVSKSESQPDFQGQNLLSWPDCNSAGMTDGGLKPKVFNSKLTMRRRMGLVLKPKSHPEFQGQDLVSWMSYNSAGMTAKSLNPKVFNCKSSMGRLMDRVSTQLGRPNLDLIDPYWTWALRLQLSQFQHSLCKICLLWYCINYQ